MNNQYLQWITGPRRGEVESAEMMQDGQTFEDVVILSNGRKVPMAQVGKDFIILPSATAALNTLDLDVMYPKPAGKQNRVAQKQKNVQEQPLPQDHASIMGLDVPQEEGALRGERPERRERERARQRSNFASDLLSRAKKEKTSLSVDIDIDMPTASFFAMMNDTFDDSTVNEVVEILVDEVGMEQIRNAMKQSITKYYGEKK